MGRKKIKIERITDERNRQVTFNKRKNGLLKKAMELSLLCDSSVALIIMNNSPTAKERVFEYCSTELDKHLVRYVDVSEPGVIKYTNTDYYKLFGKKGSMGSDGECSPDEGIPPPPLHHHTSPTMGVPHAHIHQEPVTRDPLPSNGSVPTHPNHSFNGYTVAIQHKEHYPVHGQSFEDFLKQSNYGPMFDASPSSYFESSTSSSISHEHPSHHGTLFCPPIQLSKDLLPSHPLPHPHPHPHPHAHGPHHQFPFTLGVPINSATVMAPMHAYAPPDPGYAASHRERDMAALFSHSSYNNHTQPNANSNHQTQTSPLSSSSPSASPPPLPQQHVRLPKDPLSLSSSVESSTLSNTPPEPPETKKRKIEKST